MNVEVTKFLKRSSAPVIFLATSLTVVAVLFTVFMVYTLGGDRGTLWWWLVLSVYTYLGATYCLMCAALDYFAHLDVFAKHPEAEL